MMPSERPQAKVPKLSKVPKRKSPSESTQAEAPKPKDPDRKFSQSCEIIVAVIPVLYLSIVFDAQVALMVLRVVGRRDFEVYAAETLTNHFIFAGSVESLGPEDSSIAETTR